jgi:uncharacterized membrane protein
MAAFAFVDQRSAEQAHAELAGVWPAAAAGTALLSPDRSGQRRLRRLLRDNPLSTARTRSGEVDGADLLLGALLGAVVGVALGSAASMLGELSTDQSLGLWLLSAGLVGAVAGLFGGLAGAGGALPSRFGVDVRDRLAQGCWVLVMGGQVDPAHGPARQLLQRRCWRWCEALPDTGRL